MSNQKRKSIEEDGESCTVCMSRPRTVRNQPCGHATLCELCTIKIIDPQSQSCQCPLGRCEVTSLLFLPATVQGAPRPKRMASYATGEPTGAEGARTFATLLEFLQAMLDSDSEDVAAAAREQVQRWERSEWNYMHVNTYHHECIKG